jgi:drug/metabolite transporter (DMT)-like permease
MKIDVSGIPGPLRAALWMVGTLLSFTTMAIAVREVSPALSVFEILFLRSLVGLAIILVLVQRAGWGVVATRRPGLQVMRNIVHFAGQFGWTYGVLLIPLAQAFAIEFTTPIWTALLAALFLGERFTGPRIFAVVVGFIGILVVLRPDAGVINVAALAVLGGAFGYAASNTMTKRLTRDDAPLAIIFYMTVVQLPLGLIPALGDWVTPEWADAPWFILLGIAGLSAHFCMARAFLLADATFVVPIDFLRLPLIAWVGFAFYGEGLEPATLIGAVVIFVGVYVMIRAESRRSV